MINKFLYKIKCFLGLEKYNCDEKEFMVLNALSWKRKKEGVYDGEIYIYPGTRCLMHIAQCSIVAKAIEEKEGKKPVVLLDGSKGNPFYKSKIYESFGINCFVNISVFQGWLFCRTFYDALCMLFICDSGDKILKLKYLGCDIGPAVYDSVLRGHSNYYTVPKLKISDGYMLSCFLYKMQVSDHLFREKNIKELIYTDLDYMPRRAIEIIARKYGCVLYQTLAEKTIKYYTKGEKNDRIKDRSFPIEMEFKKFLRREDYKKVVQEYLLRRFEGKGTDPCSVKAYDNKVLYSKEGLYSQFNIKDLNAKTVFVVAHAFSDLPHYGRNMIYRDYYCWLVETLKILNMNMEVNVFLKEHPMAISDYDEGGAIEGIIEKYQLYNIHLLPKDFNTLSIRNIGDYVVTCQGTIGLEMSCFGIPCFTAGQGYYYGYGIDINSTNEEEYLNRLENIVAYQKLGEDVRTKARALLTFIYLEENKGSFMLLAPINERLKYGDKYYEYPYTLQYRNAIRILRQGGTLRGEYYNSFFDYLSIRCENDR